MSTLILFAAAAPFRGAVQLGDGTRALLRGVDALGDDSLFNPLVFIDEFGIEVGSRARFLERSGAAGTVWRASLSGLAGLEIADPAGKRPWRGRDVFALIIKRFMQAAERAFGLEIYRLVVVVPPGLDQADGKALVEAGHIAGCALVDLQDLAERLAASHDSEVGKRHLLIQHDRDQLRLSLFRCDAARTRFESIRDLSDGWSGERLVERVLPRLTQEGRNPLQVQEFLADELRRWSLREASEKLIASDFGPPQPLYLPAEARSSLAQEIIDQVTAVLTLVSVAPTKLDWVHLHGPWCAELGGLFSALAPVARISVLKASADALELAVPEPVARPVLSSAVWAGSSPGDRIAVHTARQIPLLSAGNTLPALYYDEGFASEQFFQSVAVFMANGGEPVQIGALPLPRLYEQRSHCRFRLRVIADTPDYVVLLGDLAIESNSHIFIFDKSSETFQEIDQRIIALLSREAQIDRSRLG